MLRQGTILGERYEILSQIGSGGMSDVYKAKCHKLNREVAIKVLKNEFSADQNFVSKFRMEAQSAAGLSHPNIVSVYDVGEDQGVYYIVMELIKGITLKKYIERKKKLEIRESIEVAMQVARGIDAAHRQHIIHRDIKPQNIMISMDGKVKVTDFGIARAVSTQTISSNSMGSVHYISPEQARGGYCDEKSDLYSLGITFYEMLTGRVPFDGDSTVAVALLHIQGEMVPPRQYEPLIPISLEKIIMKCTQKKPELRYQSAQELIRDLKKALTMPNEDFVKIPRTNGDSASPVHDTNEIRGRRNSVNPRDFMRRSEESEPGDYEQRRRRRRPAEYEEAEDYDNDDDSRLTGEKIVTALSLVVSFIIIIIAAILLLKGCSISNDESETVAIEQTTAAAEQVEMKNLLGLSRSEATKVLTELRLTYTIDTGNSEDYPEGTIYEQQYKEGEMLDVGTEVLIRISVGSGNVTVPDVGEGLTVKAASKILETAGIIVSSEVIESNSSTVQEGRVIGTDPAAGTDIKKEQMVKLIVSSGPALIMINVPDLTNMKEADAISALESSGLKAGRISYENSDDVEDGYVISQVTVVGTAVEEGTTVDFTVSQGSSSVEMPNLKGKTLKQAKALLKEKGLKVGTVKEDYTNAVNKGCVFKQSVKAGTKIKKDTTVNITVSKGKKSTTSATSGTTVPARQEGDDSGDSD